jgi:hypothetical protein
MIGSISFVISPIVVLAGYLPYDSQSTDNDARLPTQDRATPGVEVSSMLSR